VAAGAGRLLKYPLAVPPVRRHLLVRLAPELATAMIVALFLVVWERSAGQLRFGLWESLGWMEGRFERSQFASPDILAAGISRAALIASEAAGLLMLVAPIPFVAASFAAERERGTLESVLLTSTHHNLVVRGRFVHVALPWCRMAAYLLPLYALIAFEPMFTMNCASWSVGWLNLMGWVLGLARGTVWTEALTRGPGPHAFFLAGMRWLHDFSGMMLVIAVTFFISLRARSTIRAALLSFLAVPALLVFLFNPDIYWLLGALALPDAFVSVRVYWLMALTVMAVRWGTAYSIVKRSERNFDAYVLGEKPDTDGRRPRRRI
jgi:hypothetical protein